MSTIDNVLNYLQNADLSKIDIEVDGNDRATITKFSIDALGSIEAGAGIIALDFTTKDGVAHNVSIQTDLSRHSDKNKITWDGQEANTVIVDPDLMGTTAQLEFRCTVPVEGETALDQEVSFIAGGGNHQIRFIA